MKPAIHCLVLFVMLLCSAFSAFAQSGTVSGIVTDKEEGSTLPGAAVYLQGSETTGTVTDIDGQFILSGLSEGEHIVMVSFLGFVVQEVSVQISGGESVNIKVELEADVVLGQEVIVTGQALGQAKAINQQLNAESISNIVAADRIQELPDVNAAEAIARLPGVSINRSGGEGQKIVVRGLEPKFNAITVNGVRMPANDANDRSVDLSLISPEMLEGIELFKAP
ncbi:MAG: TonB-dependent receptor plug domain-containing protein, partial [Saprospiraceae bacterium]|nr:TonB-dependent receptor plug domain-containing protein [Saprospiraceae bacterium]